MTKLEFPVYKSRYRFAISATGQDKKGSKETVVTHRVPVKENVVKTASLWK